MSRVRPVLLWHRGRWTHVLGAPQSLHFKLKQKDTGHHRMRRFQTIFPNGASLLKRDLKTGQLAFLLVQSPLLASEARQGTPGL